MATFVFVLGFVLLGMLVVLAAMRSGRRTPVLNTETRSGRRLTVAIAVVVTALFGVGLPIAVGYFNGNEQTNRAQSGLTLTEEQREGRDLFGRNCAQCHTLRAANAVSPVGPNLDTLRPPRELTLDAIENGRSSERGQMPAGLVEGEQAERVAAFIEAVAGR